MTLLVLELHLPDLPPNAPNVQVAPALWQLWPKFLTYTVSFLSLGVYWIGPHSRWVRTRRSTLRPVSSSSPLSTGRAALTASGAAPEVILREYHGASVSISVACTDVQPCLIPLHQPPLADCEGTAGACAGYCVRHGPLSSVLPQARGLRRQSSSWCTWLYWVGTGRVT